MSLGKIDIWVTTAGEPCHISELGVDYPHPWVIAIWDCCGRLLNWCGTEYVGLPTKCGHLEVEVPPGCYVIRGAEAMGKRRGEVWGNYWTDHAVVQVCCGEESCVTLVAPSVHQCGWGWLFAIEKLAATGQIDKQLADQAIRSGRALLDKLPQSDFEKATEKTLYRLSEAAEGGGQRKA